MGDEADDALFTARVRQVNRDCLNTFMPYIKLFAGILITTAGIFIGLAIYFYQMQDDRSQDILSMTTDNRGELIYIKQVAVDNKEEIRLLKVGK